MIGDILGKSFSIVFRTERVKTAPVEYKAKRQSLDSVFQEVDQHEPAWDVGLRGFLFGFFQGDVRDIRARDLKALPGQPYGVVSGPAADVQGFAFRDRMVGDGFDQVEVRLAEVPGRVS